MTDTQRAVRLTSITPINSLDVIDRMIKESLQPRRQAMPSGKVPFDGEAVGTYLRVCILNEVRGEITGQDVDYTEISKQVNAVFAPRPRRKG